MTTRRGLLRSGLGLGLLGLTRKAFAEGEWGDIPESLWPRDSGGGHAGPIGRILELYLYGGLSPWESFLVPSSQAAIPASPGTTCAERLMGTSGAGGYATFASHFASLHRRSTGSTTHALPFASGFALGPTVWPLWQFAERMRVLVMKHDLTPHEGAIPYALTGSRLGRANFAATGAAVGRRFLASSGVPASAVVWNGMVRGPDNVGSIFATGTHGGAFAPLNLQLNSGCSLPPNFSIFERRRAPAGEALLGLLRRRYAAQWRTHQSTALDQYNSLMGMYDRTDELASALSRSAMYPSAPNTFAVSCAPSCAAAQQPFQQHGLNLAAYLLREQGMRHVAVIDGGTQVAGYDTHDTHVRHTEANLAVTTQVLAALLDASASGGPALPADTLVVIHTEFGRTPLVGVAPDGRDHWPFGYAGALILPRGVGSGRSMVGSLDVNYRGDESAITPTDLKAAMLLSLGIDPYANGNFAVGGVSQRFAGSERDSRRALAHDLLGVRT